MRVLVTGAAGYIGRAVVHELVATGHEVIAFVHRSAAAFPGGVEVRRGDLLDEESLTAAARGAQGVVHLAALARARTWADHPTRHYRVNVSGTVNLLDAMAAETHRTGRPGRLVFTSTAAVYGAPAEQPIREDAPLRPLNSYGASKAAAEQAIGWETGTGRLGATVLRLFNATGAGAGMADRDESKVVPRATAVAAAAGGTGPLKINGDGTAVRDFVAVTDVARAVSLALAATEPGRCRVYNVGATPASVREIVSAVEEVTRRPVPVEYAPKVVGEAPVLRADATRIRRELGWTPECSDLRTLLREQWAAYRQGQEASSQSPIG